MKRLIKSIKKVTAVFLSMILSFPLLWTAPAFPALAAEITLTSADLVSANYEGLSDKEKAVLTSGLMSGSSFSFGTPEGMDSDLVSVNTIDATITALPYASGTYQWNPVSAKVLYGDEEETVTLTNGVGAYAYEGNDFRVEVRYEVSIPVDAAEQEKLLNGPHYLAKGLENIAAVADQESGFFTVGDNVSMLKKLIDGSLPHNASLNTSETIAAIQHLIDDADSNAGYLTIDLLIMDGYFMANSPSEYLIQNGAVFKAAAVSVYNDMKQIAEDGGVDSLLELLRTQSTTDYRKLSRAISSLRSIVDGIEEATSDDWTILESGRNPLKAEMTTAEYQALDGLLQAAGATSLHEDQILTALTGPAVTLAENVNQFDVTIKISANRISESTIDSVDLTPMEEHQTVIHLISGLSAAEIEAAVVANGIEADTLSAWAVIGSEHYDRSATALPEFLTENITYTITYVPKQIPVTADYEGCPESVPYGYNMMLPLHEGTALVYDYVVNGVSYLQGEVVSITGETAITRTEARPWDVKRLAFLTADSYESVLTAEEKAILSSDALKSDNILLRTPKNEDGLVTVSGSGSAHTVTASAYPSGISGVVWTPVSGTVKKNGSDVAEIVFSGGTASFTGEFDDVEVLYELKLTNIDSVRILGELNLIRTLVEEVDVQKQEMETMNSQYDDLEQLDQVMLKKVQLGVNGSNMSQAAKDAVKTILNSCIDKTEAKLYLFEYLTEYRQSGLQYYYQNSNYLRIRNQVEILRSNFTTVFNDPEFLPLLHDLELEEYYEKIEEILNKVEELTVPSPNARVNTASPELGTLVAGLESLIGEQRSFSEAALPITLQTTLTGAIEDSGEITVDDVVRLLYHVYFGDLYPLTRPSDYDHDAVVSDVDAIYLMYHIAFPDLYPLE